MDILFLIIGLLAGGLIAWFVAQSKNNKRNSETDIKLSMAEEKFINASGELESIKKELYEKQDQFLELSKKLVAKETEFDNLQAKLKDQREEVEKLQDKFRTEFKILANDILEEKTKKFTIQNKENLGEILKPLGEKIRDFEKKVGETYEKGIKDQTDLKAELRRLHELNLKLDEDARNLTNALKSDTKKQGNWGEVILERVLERSGLVKGQEYIVQPSGRDEQGVLLRPDVIVNLPDDKHIIIDSKVSLLAYEAFSNNENANEKEKLLKQHIDSIRGHIKGLSEKNYQNLEGLDTPDFVLLFLPIESAFSVAIQTDIELFNYAWERKIVIVSPTTLLATLRTVASIWKHEKQTQNAFEIARQGGALYDKFVSFLKDLEKIGNQLSIMQRSYDEAHKKLSSGAGNLIGRTEKLRKLGLKTTKTLPKSFLDDENPE